MPPELGLRVEGGFGVSVPFFWMCSSGAVVGFWLVVVMVERADNDSFALGEGGDWVGSLEDLGMLKNRTAIAE